MSAKIYRIDKRYTMETEITERTLQVSEAFGISLDDEQLYTVYDGLEISLKQGDVVYITGDSGSGKSILLSELYRQVPNSISFDDIDVNPYVPIIDAVGETVEDALYLLSIVGLADAFIFLRKYPELSDGQKYRFKLAKLVEKAHEADAWFVDEFGAVLDRETAKVVAFNMQKIARRHGKTLVVATTHRDLGQDLHFDVLIEKGLENDVEVVRLEPVFSGVECSLVKELKLEEGTMDDYRVLSRFHYRDTKVTAPSRIFTYKNPAGEVVGVIVYMYPFLSLAGRNKVTNRYKAVSSEVAKQLNEEVTMISRVVLHPKYRGIGLGAKLIRETMPLTGKRYVEALTVMGRFNPFNEKGGLRRVEYDSKDKYKTLRQRLQLLGWDFTFASSRKYNVEKLKSLDEGTYRHITGEIIKKVRGRKDGGIYGTHGKVWTKERSVDDYSIDDIAELVKEIVPREKIYFIWENPDWRQKGEEDE